MDDTLRKADHKTYTELVAEFISKHGIQPVINGQEITFSVPYADDMTGDRGTLVQTVSTFAEAREALGY